MVLFLIATITTTGYGDISPTTDLQLFFVIPVILMGLLFYSYVIGKIRQALNDSTAVDQYYDDLVDEYNSILLNIENKRRLQFDDSFLYPFTDFIPVLWNCKAANSLSVKHNPLPCFKNQFFDQLPHFMKQQIFLRFVEEFKEQDSGFLKLFENVFDSDFFQQIEFKM